MPVSKQLLTNFDLFKPLHGKVIDRICNESKLVEVPRRKIVMEKNQIAHSLGLLIDGRLQGIDMTIDGREAGLYFIEPNDFFGELSVIDRLPAPEFIISLTTSHFIMIPASYLRQIINENPEIAALFNARLAQRLRESMQQRTLLTIPSPLQRICAQLVQMTIKIPPGEQVIIYAPTHQELAIMINSTRETVTRVFQKLQKKGIILREGNTLKINDLSRLKNTASNGNID
jgi:CRP/FNR family transcriptional regulator, cyclic AMP receptor protein